MKNYFVALAFMAVLLPVACACGTPEPARSGDGDPLPGNPGAKSYKNPVFREFLVADPTVIRAEDGNFYLYATESGKNNIPILRSSDLVNWTKVGEVFTAENHPQITDKAGPTSGRRTSTRSATGMCCIIPSRGRTTSTPSAWRRAPRLSGPLPTTGN